MEMKRHIITIYADYPENCTKHQIFEDINTALQNQIILYQSVRIEDDKEFIKKKKEKEEEIRKSADRIAWHLSEYNPANDPNRLMWR